MRTTLFFGSLLLACTTLHIAQAQHDDGALKIPDVRLPNLPPTGSNAAAFAPAGWVVQTQATGDLNADGRPDLAFVLHGADKRNIVHNKGGLGVDELDTNPRILAVAFANANGAGYTLAAENGTLIPRWISPTQDDNFEKDEGRLAIARGAFIVSLHYFSNAGGWDAGSTSFTFRWQNAHFELIGADNENLTRNTGDNTSTSVNYSTGLVLIKVTNDETSRTKTRRKQLPSKPLLTLDQVGDGMEFQLPGVSE